MEMREQPDPTPVEVPAEMFPEDSLEERLKQFIRQEVSQQAVQDDYGSFEDEDDFELEDDDPDPLSDYQILMMAEDFELENSDDPALSDMGPVDDALEEAISPSAAGQVEHGSGIHDGDNGSRETASAGSVADDGPQGSGRTPAQ